MIKYICQLNIQNSYRESAALGPPLARARPSLSGSVHVYTYVLRLSKVSLSEVLVYTIVSN
jgi:hypothetical protein